MTIQSSLVAANWAQIQERIARAAERCGRRADEITVVAVSKTHPAEAIVAAYDAGLRHFGENRVQEWEGKHPKAAHLFRRVDSLDDLALAKKLHAAADAEGKCLPVLIEVRLGDEETKSGVAEADLQSLATSIAPFAHLEFAGLMTIPPFFDEPERVRPFFRKLRELCDDLSRKLSRALPVLSMGMSHDFEIAIEEGATEIRVGTALFGPRGFVA